MVRAKQNRHCLRVCQDVHFLYSVDIIPSTIRCSTDQSCSGKLGKVRGRAAAGEQEVSYFAVQNYTS